MTQSSKIPVIRYIHLIFIPYTIPVSTEEYWIIKRPINYLYEISKAHSGRAGREISIPCLHWNAKSQQKSGWDKVLSPKRTQTSGFIMVASRTSQNIMSEGINNYSAPAQGKENFPLSVGVSRGHTCISGKKNKAGFASRQGGCKETDGE
jgi:hypothetical protein